MKTFDEILIERMAKAIDANWRKRIDDNRPYYCMYCYYYEFTGHAPQCPVPTAKEYLNESRNP